MLHIAKLEGAEPPKPFETDTLNLDMELHSLVFAVLAFSLALV